MQVNPQEVSAGEATTPSNLKRYTVSEPFEDREVTLEVNTDVLTTEVATMINEFWTGHVRRLRAENGDPVRTVIRLFGEWMINHLLAAGGASFNEHTKSPMGDSNPAPLWTADIHNEEGWGGTVEGSLFGWCGIRCVAADVSSPEFDGLVLEEVSRG